MNRKPTKPKPRKPAPQVAAKPIEPGVEALRGIKQLVAAYNFIEASRKYKTAMQNGATTGCDEDLKSIERRLVEIVPESFDEVFALLEFTTQKIADRLVVTDGKLEHAILLRNLRKGILAAKTRRDVELTYQRVDEKFKERRELVSLALKG